MNWDAALMLAALVAIWELGEMRFQRRCRSHKYKVRNSHNDPMNG